MPTAAPANRPASLVDTFPIVTDVGVTPVWSWKADAGMGGAFDPLDVLLVELVDEQAVSSPAASTRQTANVGSWLRRTRTII